MKNPKALFVQTKGKWLIARSNKEKLVMEWVVEERECTRNVQ